MNITFRHPSGVFETVPGVGVTVGVQFAPGLGTIAPAGYTVPSGYTEVQTTLTSGSPASVLGGTGGYYLRFYNGLTQTLILPKFKMDDAAALNTARQTIEAAFAADDAAITIDSTGALYSGS
jgi:hypothetical protein